MFEQTLDPTGNLFLTWPVALVPVIVLLILLAVSAEIGKPVALQTASVGVSMTRFVRNEGGVIRHNLGWTFLLLAYLVIIGIASYLFVPAIAST